MITQQRYRQMVLCGHGAAILTVNSDIASITTIPMETINLHRLKGPFDVDLRPTGMALGKGRRASACSTHYTLVLTTHVSLLACEKPLALAIGTIGMRHAKTVTDSRWITPCWSDSGRWTCSCINTRVLEGNIQLS